MGPGDRLLVAGGVCPGTIAPAMRGTGGFGYDPVFVPEGEVRSMAEMTGEEKAAISHRGRAARRMAALLGMA
jgi:XTP/dITP diphosphohydrolase